MIKTKTRKKQYQEIIDRVAKGEFIVDLAKEYKFDGVSHLYYIFSKVHKLPVAIMQSLVAKNNKK